MTQTILIETTQILIVLFFCAENPLKPEETMTDDDTGLYNLLQNYKLK